MFRGWATVALPLLNWIISDSKYSLWVKHKEPLQPDLWEPPTKQSGDEWAPRVWRYQPATHGGKTQKILLPFLCKCATETQCDLFLFVLIIKQTHQIPTDLLPSRLKSQHVFISLCSPTRFCITTTQKHWDAGRNSQSLHAHLPPRLGDIM